MIVIKGISEHVLKCLLYAVADADSVPASGIADGVLNWVGNYEGCLRAEATGEEMNVPEVGVVTHDFDAKYCRAYTHLGVSALLSVVHGYCATCPFFFSSSSIL